MIYQFIGTIVVGLVLSASVQAQGLFGYEGFANNLYQVTSTPSSALIGNDPTSGSVAEIEYGGGVIYANDTLTNTNLYVISPSTGAVINTINLAFPAGGDVITAMEFVGDTLYAGFTTEGGGDTALATINTTTGVVDLVGAFSGIGSPLGGLAWDGVDLFGVTAGGSNANLYTFNLGSGTATFQTSINEVTGAPIGLTALEFGTDGVLYALPNGQSGALAGNLLTIDVASGIYTDLGSIGQPFMNSLTSIPEPSSLIVIGVCGVACMLRRRR